MSTKHNSDSQVLADTLRGQLPQILWRERWSEYRAAYGLPYQARSLANMDYKGTGPPCKHLGRRAYYLSAEFCDWLTGR